MKKSFKKALSLLLTLVMVFSLLPATAFAAHRDSDGYPTNLSDNVILSLYTGTDFPGEPSTHTDTSKYVSFNGNFAESNNGYATRADSVLVDSIRADLVQGANLVYQNWWGGGSTTYYVWGVFDTSADASSDGFAKYFVNGTSNPIFTDANETKMIAAAKNISQAAAANYEIVWYVIKYQTSDTSWHIDGIIREKNTYSVNYYGNGATSGDAPAGVSGLSEAEPYTILGNDEDDKLVRNVAGVEYVFTGWNTERDGSGTPYAPGDTVILNSETAPNYTLSLYAQWQAKNRYTATVRLYLDNNLVDVGDLHPDTSLYISNDSRNFIPLTRSSRGVYTTTVTGNGSYVLYHKVTNSDTYEPVGQYTIPIYNANGSLDVRHFSINYHTPEGALTREDDAYQDIRFAGNSHTVISEVPARTGYVFTGWNTKTDGSGTSYQPGDVISGINQKHDLYAQWAKNVNVSVTVIAKDDETNDGETSREARIVLTHRSAGSTDSYVEVNGSSKTSILSIPTDATGVVYQNLYTDLDPRQEYSANVFIHDYKLTDKTVTRDADGNYHITVVLEYDPAGFELDYNVVVKDNVPDSYIPQALDLKITYWNNETNSWDYIDEHTGSSVDVTIDDASREGDGSYHVWGYEDANTPYYYRVEPTGIDFDGTVTLPAAVTQSGYSYTAGPYLITVEVPGGTAPIADALPGAYATGTNPISQNGTITVYIEMSAPYNVTFDANGSGAKINGDETYTEYGIYQVPTLTGYVPEWDGYHVFDGWYYDANCNGSIDSTEVQYVGGEWLEQDIVLLAKWKAPLTISGTVTISGTYQQNGQTIYIREADRAVSALVILEEVGKLGSVAQAEVNFVDYSTGTASDTYSFTVPDDGRDYNIVIRVQNYDATYDNEPQDGTFTADENVALFNGDAIAKVDAYLDFNPDSYDQKVIIDASAIGAAFRPTSALAQIYSRDLDDDHVPSLIHQHTVSPFGLSIAINPNSAQGQGNQSVWKYHFDSSRYEYSLSIANLYGDVDGVFTSAGSIDLSSAPYSIVYSDHTTWGIVAGAPLGGDNGTGILKATLVPNEYTITFNMLFDELETDASAIGGMEAFRKDSGITGNTTDDTFSTSYTWSIGSTVTGAVPTCEGFVFMGWYDASGHRVDSATTGTFTVAPETMGDYTLTARWMVDANSNQIPDEYEKQITFWVVNGTWSGGSTELSYTVELKTNGVWDANGSGTVTVPSATANQGYERSVWTPDISGYTELSVTASSPELYILTFLKQNAVDYDEVPPDLDIPDMKPSEEEVHENEKIRVVPNGGIWTCSVWCSAHPDGGGQHTDPVDLVVPGTNTGLELRHPTPPTGKVFRGWKMSDPDSTEASENIVKVFTAIYDDDVIGPNGGSDGIPDRFQKKLTFKLLNGKWYNNASTEVPDPVVRVVTLLDAQGKPSVNGTAQILPTLTRVPNYGYEGGSWALTSGESHDALVQGAPPLTVSGNNEAVYTYTFTKIADPTVYYSAYVAEDAQPIPDSQIVSYGAYIKVDPNGGTWRNDTSAQKLKVEADITLEDPTRVGYTFLGWTQTTGDTSTSPDAEISYTFTAQWKRNVYTLTYHNDSAEQPATAVLPDNASGIAYGSSVDLIPAITTSTSKDNIPGTWSFDGWYLNPELSGSPVTRVEGIVSDVDVYAKWSFTAATYTLTYRNTSAERPATATLPSNVSGIAYNGSVDLTPATTTSRFNGNIPGTWTFNGWYLNPELSGSPVTRVEGIVSNVNVYAKWTFTPTPYIVTYLNEDGTQISSGIYTYGETVTVPEDPTKAPDPYNTYTFSSWVLVSGSPLGAGNTCTGDAVFRASFTSTTQTYTVSYDLNGGSSTDTLIYAGLTYNTGTPTIADPTRAGYTFAGWSPSVAPTVVGNAIYTAQWIQDKYTVTYTDGVDGLEVFADQKTENLLYGDSTPAFNGTPTRTGFAFLGWTPTVAGTVTANVTYTALWASDADGDGTPDSQDFYTVTYDLNGGSSSEALVYSGLPHGTPTPTIADPTRAGYTFTGWAPTIASIVTGDATYTAQWTQDKYTVTYTDGVDGLEVFADQKTENLLYGDSTPAFNGTPTRTGYTFAGWSPAVADTVTGNTTYTAQWTVIAVITDGFAQLTKVDANDPNTVLPQAVFKLYRVNRDGSETLVGTYTTNSAGKITVANLDPGSYFWREFRPPAGYQLDATKHHFTVRAAQTARVTVTNVHSSVPDAFTDQHYAYIIGRSDGNAHPEAYITRAEVVTIFFRLLKDEIRQEYLTTENPFPDVNEGDWFNTAVSTVTALGIINGCSDGTFSPYKNITRAEFAALCARFDPYSHNTDATFEDVYGHWAEDEIAVAVANGWILGTDSGTFLPNQEITRAEAMTVLNRVLQRIPRNVDDLLPGMIEWPDNMDPKKWYYLAVQEATNSHAYDRNSNGYEYWISLMDAPDWTVFEK